MRELEHCFPKCLFSMFKVSGQGAMVDFSDLLSEPIDLSGFQVQLLELKIFLLIGLIPNGGH